MEFFKILWRLLKPFKRQFLIYLVLVTFWELFGLANSYIISLVIDFIGRGFDTKLFIIFMAVVLVFDELFRQLDRRTDWQIIVRLLNPIYYHLKRTALKRFMEMEMRWHRQQRSGTLMGKVQEGTSKILGMVEGICWEFVPTIIQVIVSLVPLIFLSLPIAGILLGSLSIFMLVTIRQRRVLEPLWKRRHDAYDDEWGMAEEMVKNVEVTALYNQQSRLLADHRSILDTVRDTSEEESEVWIHRYGRWRLRVQGIAQRTVLVLLVVQVTQGMLTIGSMVFIWTLTERLFHAFWRFARLYDRASESLEAAKRLEGVMDLTPLLVSPVQPKAIPPGPVTLTFENVGFSYGGNGESIHNLNLVIRGGETVGIVGPSGAGKTTLRRLLTRSWDVSEGRILVNGVDVRDLSLSDLRATFSYVPQGDEVAIFNETFVFNIAFGRPEAPMREVIEAAKTAGIHDFILGCEDGYDTLLGERGLRLSGGQKQRVVLARAILADQPVLILDEATSSVDSITEDEIQERLIPIFKDRQRTVIVIAHRLSTIWGVADRILVFDEGELVEEGTHEELLERNGLYAELFERQFKKVKEVLSQA